MFSLKHWCYRHQLSLRTKRLPFTVHPYGKCCKRKTNYPTHVTLHSGFVLLENMKISQLKRLKEQWPKNIQELSMPCTSCRATQALFSTTEVISKRTLEDIYHSLWHEVDEEEEESITHVVHPKDDDPPQEFQNVF